MIIIIIIIIISILHVFIHDKKLIKAEIYFKRKYVSVMLIEH